MLEVSFFYQYVSTKKMCKTSPYSLCEYKKLICSIIEEIYTLFFNQNLALIGTVALGLLIIGGVGEGVRFENTSHFSTKHQRFLGNS